MRREGSVGEGFRTSDQLGERSLQTLVDFGSPPSYHHNTTLSAAAETTPAELRRFILLPTTTAAPFPRHRAASPVVARFSARFQRRSLSFLRLFANAPRPITSGTPHPRRYASALFFPRASLLAPFPLSHIPLLFLASASSFFPCLLA